MYKVNIELSNNNNNSSKQSASQQATNPQSNDYFPIAKYIVKDTSQEIANLLSWKDIFALKYVSKFFNQNLDYHFLKNRFNQLLRKKMIIIGGESTFVNTLDGKVYGCGLNNYGQLGFRDVKNRLTPEELPFGSIEKLVAGPYYTFFQLKDGRILCYGANFDGQLGLGNKVHRIIPKKLSLPFVNNQNIQIVAGNSTAFIIDEKGSIWGAGSNLRGELGFENEDDYCTFSILPIDAVKQVISNGGHTFFLKDKEIWGCGSNHSGQLGLNFCDGKLAIQKIFTDPVMKIISGIYHTLIQKEDGVWGCGSNKNGQLGLGNDMSRSDLVRLHNSVKKVFAGPLNTFLLLENGQVWACGKNYHGELGLGNADCPSQYQLKQLPIEPNQVVEIIAGPDHTLFLLKDGRILGCGSNANGQLGLGSDISKALTPRELPELTECLGLHALYKKIEALNPANNVNKNSNQKSEKSNEESNSSEFQNNNNSYKP